MKTLILIKARVMVLTLLGSSLLLSCSTTQIEKTKAIASTTLDLTVASLPVLARVAVAYGAPYAEIVTAFASATNPDEFSDDFSEDYSDDMQADFDLADYDNDGDGIVDEEFDSDGDGIPDDSAGDDETSYSESEDDDYSSEGYSDELLVDLVADVDIVREALSEGNASSVAVRDGDALSSNDNYKLQLGCNVECYAYVAQLDATGRMDPILPSNFVSQSNYLEADQIYSIPSDDDWFYLDESKGLEHVYFIFSQTPRDDLEEIFDQLAQSNQTLIQQEKVSIQENMTLTRGIAGTRQGSSQTISQSNGDTGEYISTVINGTGADLVLTRWFRHE